MKIGRAPLVRHILEEDFQPFLSEESKSRRSILSRTSTQSTPSRSSSNMEREVLKHRNETVVTPIVKRIAKHLFTRHLDVAGEKPIEEIEEGLATEIDEIQAHHLDPKSMVWGDLVFKDEDGISYYGDITMDEVTYSVSTFASQQVHTVTNFLTLCIKVGDMCMVR